MKRLRFLTLILMVVLSGDGAVAEVTNGTPSTVTPDESTGASHEPESCEPGVNDHRSVGFRCAMGVIHNIRDLIQLPGNILQLLALSQERLDECNSSPDIKRGMLLVVEPLIVDGADRWMDRDCVQLFEMARNLEQQGTREIMRKLRLQETLRGLMASQEPLSPVQQEVFDERMQAISLTPEQQQFWDRKNARDEIVARAQQAALRRTWNYVRQEWQCADVRDVLTGACNVIADIGLGGGSAFLARQAGRGARNIVGNATRSTVAAAERGLERVEGFMADRRLAADGRVLERMPEDPTPAEILQGNALRGEGFYDNGRRLGLEFAEDGTVASINGQASELAEILSRLQSQYGVDIRAQDNGFGTLVRGVQPQTGQTFINLDPETLLRPQAAVARLQRLERQLQFSRRNGVMLDETNRRLLITDLERPIGQALHQIERQFGVTLRPTLTTDPLRPEGGNVVFNIQSGTMNIHPDLLAPGQERRLLREIEQTRNRSIQPFHSARTELSTQHGITLNDQGRLIASNPYTGLGRVVRRLNELGVSVEMDPASFSQAQGMSNAAAFARGQNHISIRPDYFAPERADQLLSILNHEITHITTSRRALAGQLAPATARAYSGRSVNFTTEGTNFSLHRAYQNRFQADEFEARVRQANIGYRSGVQSPMALSARREAILFGETQLELLVDSQLRPSNWTVEAVNGNQAFVTFRVPSGGGHVNMRVPIYSAGTIDSAQLVPIARAIVQERVNRLRRDLDRLRQRGR